MKNITLIIIAILINNSPIFALENIRTDARSAGMGGYAGSPVVENSFAQNPASINFDNSRALSIGYNFNPTIASEFLLNEGTIFFKNVMGKKKLVAIGACASMTSYGYSGSYPGAQSMAWSTIYFNAAAALRIGKLLQVGASGIYDRRQLQMTVHGEKPDATFDIDANAGVALTGNKISVGLSALNMTSLIDNALPELLLNITGAPGRLLLSETVSYNIDDRSIGSFTGLEFNVIKKLIYIRTGLKAVNTFTSFYPTAGLSLNIKQIRVNYATEYDLTTTQGFKHTVSLDYSWL